ncbi:hypothetical protein DV737_g2372, partial [Chaetothyriales sp. CBS 132003]
MTPVEEAAERREGRGSREGREAGAAAKATPVYRYYIDVRALAPPGRKDHVDLPLLSTLPQELQASIQKYVRPVDRLMSLSSALLKYYFIHTQARLPWDQVHISRTARPHGRPYWSPPDSWRLSHDGGLEFNVTHQNGLIGLVGCTTPTMQDPQAVEPTTTQPTIQQQQVRLGVDVACVRETGRSPADVTTQAKLDEWIDIFGEMFSDECRNDIRSAPPPAGAPTSVATTMQARLRRFYAFWALKEAYIKMVGEGLLADWLTKLEFENVQVPQPATEEDWVDADDGFSWALRTDEDVKWTPGKQAVRDIGAVLDGKQVNGVQLGLVAYEHDFLFATAMRGVVEQAGGDTSWRKLDFDNDIRPCAEGRCSLAQHTVTMISQQTTGPTGSGSAVAMQADVSVEADCKRVVDSTLERFGRVDILCNNVGVGGPPGTAVDVDMAQWARGMEVNVASMVMMAKYAIPAMLRNQIGSTTATTYRGCIVNMSSVAGIRGGTPSLLYPTSKGAVVNLTRAMAAHHAKDGIRVNCVCPGMVYTPMMYGGGMSAEAREARKNRSLLQVEGNGWDVGASARFLVGEESRWITGECLVVDAGTTSSTSTQIPSDGNVGQEKRT